MRHLRFIGRKIIEDKGNIESAMVLIPLLFLFLCSAQLISTTFLRNSALINAQSEASTRAISGELIQGDSIVNVENSDRFHDLRLLIVRNVKDLPMLVPGLGRIINKRLESDIKGVAIIEVQP
jgi:hypothetical protein